jgi:hypothetical protein
LPPVRPLRWRNSRQAHRSTSDGRAIRRLSSKHPHRRRLHKPRRKRGPQRLRKPHRNNGQQPRNNSRNPPRDSPLLTAHSRK